MSSSGPLGRQTPTSPSRLSSNSGLHPKSAACALNLPAVLRGSDPPPSGRRAAETGLLSSKRSLSTSPPPLPPGSGSEPQMSGGRPGSPESREGAAARAARSARVDPAPHPLRTADASTGLRCRPCPFLPLWPYFSVSSLRPPVFSRTHLLFSQVSALHHLSFSSPVQ